MKIDESTITSKDSVQSKYSIEATLYDTGKCFESDGNVDILSSDATKMELCPSTDIFGFQGYVLRGRLEKPMLWSAEKVQVLINYSLLTFLYNS